MIYFTEQELSFSLTAAQNGIANTPTKAASRNLENLVDYVLDPLRAQWGKPIIVTSGYRGEKLNALIGGVPHSQHLLGEAADITAGSRVANDQLFHLIQRLGLPYDQLIWEKGDETGPDWIHVSFRLNDNRHQTIKV